ncbi:MAG: C40 family peptidase [Acidobacteria bacterium]|nr:C40 family peptidase [Acidobacteriota bacterium]
MRKAYRLVVCLLALSGTLVLVGMRAEAQDRIRISGRDLALREIYPAEFSRSFRPGAGNSIAKPYSRNTAVSREREAKTNIEAMLYLAIRDRLGAPYRSSGTDDRGYDCSGFVWRVFQEAGIDLTRTSARTLWKSLPEATEEEETEFGTLVFFEGLTHVGIVRDRYSFYHASTSQGVTRSFYSGYWEDKVIGFRRVPLPKKMEPTRK